MPLSTETKSDVVFHVITDKRVQAVRPTVNKLFFFVRISFHKALKQRSIMFHT